MHRGRPCLAYHHRRSGRRQHLRLLLKQAAHHLGHCRPRRLLRQVLRRLGHRLQHHLALRRRLRRHQHRAQSRLHLLLLRRLLWLKHRLLLQRRHLQRQWPQHWHHLRQLKLLPPRKQQHPSLLRPRAQQYLALPLHHHPTTHHQPFLLLHPLHHLPLALRRLLLRLRRQLSPPRLTEREQSLSRRRRRLRIALASHASLNGDALTVVKHSLFARFPRLILFVILCRFSQRESLTAWCVTRADLGPRGRATRVDRDSCDLAVCSSYR